MLDARLTASLADRYRLERELGQGGMATVYLAHDLRHDRDVALKVLRPELAAILGRERFLAEIRLTAKLDHPHILTLLDSGESNGLLWYTLPFIRGESLRQKLTRERQLGVAEAVGIARQVAGALDYAHQHGVIHRDVKPENILLHEGEAMLADFGIALAVREAGGQRLTETGLSIGTPQYMSPEQATAERQLDARSDVYSLGAVLYEMLAGEPPFTGVTGQAVIAKLMLERPTPLRTVRDSVPVGLEAVVAQALAKVPADRFPSAGAFAEALAAPEAHRVPRRMPSRVLLLGGAAIVVLAGAALWLRSGKPSAMLGDPALTQVTFSGNAHGPALSPDGRLLAYGAATCPKPRECTTEVVVEDLSLRERRVLADGFVNGVYRITWSPDQRFLLFTSSRAKDGGGSYILSLVGGREQYLGTPFAAQFLGGPDTLIAIRLSTMQDENLRGATRWFLVLSRDGTPLDSIPFIVPGIAPWPIASPDGRHILIWSFSGRDRQRFYLIDRSGRLTDSLPVPFGADGQMVQWTAAGDGVVMLIRADSTDPDLRTLLRFAVNKEARVRLPPDTLTARLRLPGRPHFLPDEVGGEYVALSPPLRNGEFALALRSEAFTLSTLERPSIVAPPARTRTLITGATGALDAVISPDGERIMVARRTMLDGRPARQLELWPFRGGTGTSLGPAGRGLRGMTWSTDGASVFRLAAAGRAGLLEHSRIDVASGRILQSRTVPDSLRWAPGLMRDSLLLYRADGGRLGITPVEWRTYLQGDTSPLVFTLPDTGRSLIHATVRPDGQGSWLLTAITRPQDENDSSTYVIHVGRPGVPAERIREFRGPWWDLNILHLAPGPTLELQAEGNVVGERRLLVEPGRGPRDLGPMPIPMWPTFSVDGRRGALVETEMHTDIWLLQWPSGDSQHVGEAR